MVFAEIDKAYIDRSINEPLTFCVQLVEMNKNREKVNKVKRV